MASTEVVSMIKFKSISSQLSDSEMDAFMTRLWRIFGRDRILQFLCTSFSGLASNQKYDDLLPTASGIVTQIIQKRECEDEDNDLVPISITDLPCCLVGEIASNLDQSDYRAFSNTNRKHFVDCNSPNRLKEMYLDQNSRYQKLGLQNFHQIEYLGFPLHRITDFHRINNQIFSGNNRVHQLVIDIDYHWQRHLECLINDESQCISSMKILELKAFEASSTTNAKQFVKLLTKFEKLETLRLHNVSIQGDKCVKYMNGNHFRTLCPMISELYLEYCYPVIPFPWGTKITTLFFRTSLSHYIPHSLELTSLKRLYFEMLDGVQSVDLLESAKNVREISFTPHDEEYAPYSALQIENVINRCINRPKLEFLYVCGCWTDSRDELQRRFICFQFICSVIAERIIRTKNIEREWMEIVLKVDAQDTMDVELFVEAVMNAEKAFVGSKVKEWIFIVEFDEYNRDNIVYIEQIQVLENNFDFAASAELLQCTEESIIIASKDCKMERHTKWWLY